MAQAASQAAKDVRDDSKPDLNWVIFHYPDPKKSADIAVYKTGSGDIDEMAGNLQPDQVQYGYCRSVLQIDNSKTVKFGLVTWIGANTPVMIKAKSSTLHGGAYDTIGTTHVSIEASDTNEVTQAIFNELVAEAAGVGNRVVTSAEGVAKDTGSMFVAGRTVKQHGDHTQAKSQSLVPTAANATAQLTVEDVAAVKEAVSKVRSDSDDSDWVTLGYSDDDKKVVVVGSGTGGIGGIATVLDPATISYSLLRTVEHRADTGKDAVKFVLVAFLGESVQTMKRAKASTQKGVFCDLLSPYHTDVSISTREDLSGDVVAEAVGRASGNKVFLREDVQPSQASIYVHGKVVDTSHKTNTSSSDVKVSKEGQKLQIEESESVTKAVASVRDDSSTVDYCLISYKDKTTLGLLASGSGGLEELRSHLSADKVIYGIVRRVVVRKDTGKETIKFAGLQWIGDSVPIMVKAGVSTHKGFIQELLDPVHVTVAASTLDEITDNTVDEALGKASGQR